MAEEKQPTPEEIKAYRENMKKYYEDELPLLKKRKEYETLLADIAEQKARAASMYARLAQIMHPERFKEEEEKEEKPIERGPQPAQEVAPEVKEKRTLKTETE